MGRAPRNQSNAQYPARRCLGLCPHPQACLRLATQPGHLPCAHTLVPSISHSIQRKGNEHKEAMTI